MVTAKQQATAKECAVRLTAIADELAQLVRYRVAGNGSPKVLKGSLQDRKDCESRASAYYADFKKHIPTIKVDVDAELHEPAWTITTLANISKAMGQCMPFADPRADKFLSGKLFDASPALRPLLQDLEHRAEQLQGYCVACASNDAEPATTGNANKSSAGAPVTTKDVADFANTRRNRQPPSTWKSIFEEWAVKHPRDNRVTKWEQVRSAWRRHYGDKCPAA